MQYTVYCILACDFFKIAQRVRTRNAMRKQVVCKRPPLLKVSKSDDNWLNGLDVTSSDGRV